MASPGKWTIRTVALLVLLAASLALAYPRDVAIPGMATHEFTIDVPYTRVRKILVRTNAVKKIVALANAELLDQSWTGIEIDLARLLREPDWELEGEGKLQVRTNDDYIGQHDITLLQRVKIRPEELVVANTLEQPAGRLLDYRTSLRLAPDDQQMARFQTSAELTVLCRVAPIFRHVARRRVQAAAVRALNNQEKALRSVVDDHRDSLFIMPSFGT